MNEEKSDHSPLTLVCLAELMLIDHAGNLHKQDKFPSFPAFVSVHISHEAIQMAQVAILVDDWAIPTPGSAAGLQ